MILITGGTGYIGSHAAVSLIARGEKVFIIDNLHNSNKGALRRIETAARGGAIFQEGDVRNQDFLDKIMCENPIEAVLHFAALKSVSESIRQAELYKEVNFGGTENVVRAMEKANVRTLVFSSTAAVYGYPDSNPITESFQLAPVNPYGVTKKQAEDFLREVHNIHPDWSIAILRYFNACGAHFSGCLGEDFRTKTENLIPAILRTINKKSKPFKINGNDFNTLDGTPIRDYVNVNDLVEGHLQAMHFIKPRPGVHIWNLGSGKGHSVLEVITTISRCAGEQIRIEYGSRRPGDVPKLIADITKATEQLKWAPKYTFKETCASVWRWASQTISDN